MASEVSIVNVALSKLGERSILSFSDDSNAGRLANRTYAEIRDTMLREFPWNFAAKRASLAAEAAEPAWGFDRQFVLPADYLRLLDVNNTANEAWKIEGGRILTNLTAPLEIRYVARIEDADRMDPAFREALASRLAMEWAEPITGSSSVQERMANLYKVKLGLARSADGQEDYPDTLETTTFLDARW